MTDDVKTQNEQELRAQAREARGRLEQLAADLRVVDEEVERLAPQREQHELLGQACGALERLGELGAAALFWGDRIEPARAAERLHEVRSRVQAFQAQLGGLDERRQAIVTGIRRDEDALEVLADDLYDLREEEERRRLEWIVERDISPLPRRIQALAWARNGEDDRRFRRSLAAALAICLLLGALLPMIDLPLPRRFEPNDGLSKRLAQLVRESQAVPIPPPPVAEQPREERPPDQDVPDPVTEPRPEREARPEAPAVAAAESDAPPAPGPEAPAVAAAGPPQPTVTQAGILAFRDRFASRATDRVAPRLGADARFSDGDDVSQSQMPSRSMLTTDAPGSSGGINLASLSRDVGGGGAGGGGGGGIQGVEVGRATSTIASIAGSDDRPRARGGPGPARTDEEIQIVFDRYKSAFYRLYNRELRNDPTLQGQMVLRLTIEPDGSVSMCELQSTDMDAAELAAQVVSRVRTINFGAKEVPAVTIVYPIDFLPAT